MNETVFTFIKESAIITYIVHFLWIEIANRYFVYDHSMSLIPAFCVVTGFTLFGIVFTYFLVKKIPYLGLVFGITPKKKKGRPRVKSPLEEDLKVSVSMEHYDGDTNVSDFDAQKVRYSQEQML